MTDRVSDALSGLQRFSFSAESGVRIETDEGWLRFSEVEALLRDLLQEQEKLAEILPPCQGARLVQTEASLARVTTALETLEREMREETCAWGDDRCEEQILRWADILAALRETT